MSNEIGLKEISAQQQQLLTENDRLRRHVEEMQQMLELFNSSLTHSAAVNTSVKDTMHTPDYDGAAIHDSENAVAAAHDDDNDDDHDFIVEDSTAFPSTAYKSSHAAYSNAYNGGPSRATADPSHYSWLDVTDDAEVSQG